MQVTTRFAPSPTGYLHLGHAYSAKCAHDYARAHCGTYLVRFEDIDSTRCRPHFYDAILEDLAWLGLSPDQAPIRQSERTHLYEEALETLKALGVLYPCFCSRKDIEQHIASAPHDHPTHLYPQTCRHLTAAQIQQHLDARAIPSWRINTSIAAELAPDCSFLNKGHPISVNPHELGDTILARKDIGTSYHIAVTVDDAAQAITHVTRGEDLLSSTHLHCLIQRLIGFPTPHYIHHQLIRDTAHKRLAKRTKARSIRSLREEGYSPDELFSQLPAPPTS